MITPVIHRAHVDSTNFSFEAYHNDPEAARATLERDLRAHARRFGADPEWLRMAISDIQVTGFIIGRGYRDGEEIY